MSALTDLERQQFEWLGIAFSNPETYSMALVRTTLDGKEVAVIAHVTVAMDDEYIIQPVAILANQELIDRMIDPIDLMDDENV